MNKHLINLVPHDPLTLSLRGSVLVKCHDYRSLSNTTYAN